ncbi:hypothetical protein DL93DRAFT_2101572 [Clavulina sp. PMI_390]|nr:hypothetical protein DL93DRAFT_2101572 [Clavulina sp. PMI_390]
MESVNVVDLRAPSHRSRRDSSRKPRHSHSSGSQHLPIPPPSEHSHRGRSSSVGSERRYTAHNSSSGSLGPVPPSILRATVPSTLNVPLARESSTRSSNYTKRVPVPSIPGTVINVPAGQAHTVSMQRHASTSGYPSRPPVSGQAYADRGRQPRQRTSSSTSHYTTTSVRSSRPHTPNDVNYNVPPPSNVRVRKRADTEQVMFVPSGQPLIIVDERRNRNTPLPTVIRDGKVIYGGDGRTAAELQGGHAVHTVVRSDPATSVYGGDRGRRDRSQSQSRFMEVDSYGRPLDRSGVQDDGLFFDTPKRRNTWGHSNKRPPPFAHHDKRCRSPWHGLRNWWFGILTCSPERRMEGRAQYEEAMREREFERNRREKQFEHNVAAWRGGRRDVNLW